MPRVRPILGSLALATCSPQEPADRRPPAPPAAESPEVRSLALPALAACGAGLAVDPAADGRLLAWDACPSGQDGCRVLEGGDGVAYRLDAGWTEAGVVLAIDEYDRLTLAPLDGPPFLVLTIADVARCDFFDVAFDGGSAAIGVDTSSDSGETSRIYLAGPLRPDSAWHQPAARLRGFGQVSLSGRTLVTIRGGLQRSDPRSGEFTAMFHGPATCCGAAVGASTVFVADRRNILVHSDAGGLPQVLHRAPEGEEVADLHRVGGAFYWAQSVGARADARGTRVDRVELWTAAVTDQPSRFIPHKLTDLARHTFPGERWEDGIVAGGGKLAVLDLDAAEPVVEVVDVTTGALRRWSPESAPRRVVFVDADEIGVEFRRSDATYQYMRVSLDTLPAGS